MVTDHAVQQALHVEYQQVFSIVSVSNKQSFDEEVIQQFSPSFNYNFSKTKYSKQNTKGKLLRDAKMGKVKTYRRESNLIQQHSFKQVSVPINRNNFNLTFDVYMIFSRASSTSILRNNPKILSFTRNKRWNFHECEKKRRSNHKYSKHNLK